MSQTLDVYLRQCREIKNLTLREVENGAKVSNGYLNQLEKGNIKSPSPHVLYKLANFYKVPYEHLLKLAGYIVPKNEKAKKEIAGVAFSLLKDLTLEEANELTKYLAFLRQRRNK